MMYASFVIAAPEVEWEIPNNITIPEGQNEIVCFTTNIGTATPYHIVIGTRQKSLSPASSKSLPRSCSSILCQMSYID